MENVQPTLLPYLRLVAAGCVAAEALNGSTVAGQARVLVDAFEAESGDLIPLTDEPTARRIVQAADPDLSPGEVDVRARFLSKVSDALWAYETELAVVEGRVTFEAVPGGALLIAADGVEFLEGER